MVSLATQQNVTTIAIQVVKWLAGCSEIAHEWLLQFNIMKSVFQYAFTYSGNGTRHLNHEVYNVEYIQNTLAFWWMNKIQ